MKKTFSLLLASLMLVSALAACSSGPDAPESGDTTAAETTAPADTTTTETETERKDIKDNLPADLNLGGMTVKIFTREASTLRPYDVDGGGAESGDIVKDAVYARNRTVEERLKVSLEVTAGTEKWQDWGKIMESNIMAGDDTWQLYFTAGNASVQSKRDHLFQDLSELKYIDYEQPWWWTESMKELSLDGQSIRYLIGDIVLNNYTRSGAVFFNKKLYQDALGDPEELYQLVIDRKWTYDKMMEYCTKLYADLNGDGQVNSGDRYGLIMEYTEWPKYLEYSADYERYTRHADGYPVISYDMERAQAHLEKINKFLWETTGVTYLAGKQDRTVFTNGSTVFYTSQLSDVLTAEFRDMSAPYGIIPYPKQDDQQKEYTTIIQNAGNLVTIPVTCKEPEHIGAVIEALCAESYRSVVEKFYDTALKTKYVSDSTSGQCIDIIINTSKIDFSYFYTGAVGGGNFLYKLIGNNDNNLASAYSATIDVVNKNIADLAAQYAKQRADMAS